MATISDSNSPFVEVKPFPIRRNLVVDAGYLANKRHIIHGLVEVDVTQARKEIKKQSLSFTAYLVACVGRAVAQDAKVAAYRNWRGQLVIFHNDVDIVTMIEPSENAVAIPHIIRHAESRSVAVSRKSRTKFGPFKANRGAAPKKIEDSMWRHGCLDGYECWPFDGFGRILIASNECRER